MTHVRIEEDVKKRIKQLSILRGQSQKQIVANAITLLEVQSIRQILKEQPLDNEIIRKLLEMKEFFRRTDKEQYKVLIKDLKAIQKKGLEK